MKKILVIFAVVICIIVGINAVLWVHVRKLHNQMNVIQNQLKENTEANEQVLQMLTTIRDQQKEMEQQLNSIKKHDDSINQLRHVSYTPNTDLSLNNDETKELTSKDMDKIINFWINHMGVSTSFANKGSVFIKAAHESGLNPIYILAHAALESGWGQSNIARSKHNYFGINAVDTNPNESYIMGSTTTEGIVSGAKWINANFYSQGYTSLADMENGGYASDPTWCANIIDIMNTSLQAL